MASESGVTWATSVQILVFLGLCILDVGQMYATDVRQHHCLMPPSKGWGHNKSLFKASDIPTCLIFFLQHSEHALPDAANDLNCLVSN